MRRSLFGLLTVVAIAALLITTGCERDSVLRVAKVNGGHELFSDIADFGIWVDPTLPDSEQEPEVVYAFQADTTEIELQYVEIGAGLPVWTPFEAIIHRATISYASKYATPPRTYVNAVVPMNQYVMSDRENKKTTKFTMVVVPLWWKMQAFGNDVSEPPEYDFVDVVDVTIKFSGWDSVSQRTVEATGKLMIEFANFIDDEEKFGK
jgi:hypothetical protein